jgi:quinol monooxygenase YgiN
MRCRRAGLLCSMPGRGGWPWEEGMIVITGAARVADGNRAAFEQVAVRQVTLSRQEPGNVSYSYFEDRMEPGRFFFYEEWKDRAAVDFHFAQGYCHDFMEAARRLAEAEPELTIREIMVKAG